MKYTICENYKKCEKCRYRACGYTIHIFHIHYTLHKSTYIGSESIKTPSKHTNIQMSYPRSCQDVQGISSQEQSFNLVSRPTRRYMRKLALDYIFCPDCESQDIIYHGHSANGEQKHLCKECGYQFVLQFGAVFPRSRRREMFEKEFMSNLQRQGNYEGCGRKMYWRDAIMDTLQMLESNQIKIRTNKMLKGMNGIYGEKDIQLLIEFVVHEAYLLIMG